MDTDKNLIKITRDPKVLAALPAETDIPVANLESVEHKFQDFGYSHGTGIFKFIYRLRPAAICSWAIPPTKISCNTRPRRQRRQSSVGRAQSLIGK
ncbi:MAG: hypothetical protein ACLT0Y_02680 [Christensenellales bacterium]